MPRQARLALLMCFALTAVGSFAQSSGGSSDTARAAREALPQQPNDSFVQGLSSSIVECLNIDVRGEAVTGAYELVVERDTVLTALAPLVGAAGIAVRTPGGDTAADGVIAFDPRTGMALIRAPMLPAEPYAGTLADMNDAQPETIPGVLVADSPGNDEPRTFTEDFATKGRLERYTYEPLALLHRRPGSIYSGSLILGSSDSVAGMVTARLNPHTVGVTPIKAYRSLARLDTPLQGDQLVDSAADNATKAMLLLLQADVMQNLDRADETGPIIAQAIELDPANPIGSYLNADLHLINKDYAEAVPLYQKCIEQGADWGHLRYALGYCQFQAGDAPASTASLESAVKLDPHHAPALDLLAKHLLNDSRYNAAFDLALRACAIENDDIEYLSTLRRCSERLDRWDEVMPMWYRYMRSTDSRDVDLWRDYIHGFMPAIEYRVMTREAERGLGLIGEQDFLLAALAWRRLLDRQWDDAYDLAKRAIALNPENKLANRVLETVGEPTEEDADEGG